MTETGVSGAVGATGGDRNPAVPTVTGKDLAAYAKTFVGVPYVAGGRDPQGWDCAGFTWYVAKHFNIDIPEISEGQLLSGTEVDGVDNVLPGDLIVLRRKGTMGDGANGHVMMATHGRNVVHAHGGVGGTTNIQSLSVAVPSTHYIAGIRRIAGIGGATSPSAPVPGTTETTTAPGSFEDAKKYIKPRQLKDGVIFNPPQPVKKLFRLDKYPNPRGFIVRDPSVQKNFGGGKWQTFQSNYGFRFQFNPSTVAESYSAPTSGDPIQMLYDVANSNVPLLGGTSSGQVQFTLLLSRFEDMWFLKQPDWANYYPPGSITPEQRIDILERGTQADIEYLFRMCNGDPQDTWHGMTSDWGMLLPLPTIISFGDQDGVRRVRGYMTSLGWDHKVLIAGMIPVYTEIALMFNRMPDSYYDTTGTASSINSSNQHYQEKPAKDGKSVKGDMGRLMATARDMVGKYPYGAVIGPDPDPTKGLDDAAYVWYVFYRTAPGCVGNQYNGRSALMKLGRSISPAATKEGDVIFFGKGEDPVAATHVGIVSGDGTILHVSRDDVKQPVEESIESVVRKMGLNEKPITIRRIMEPR